MPETGTYQEREFPAHRIPTIDTLELGRRKHHVPVLCEIDVTTARRLLAEIKAREGRGLSFTAWVTKCVAQAVGEHKHVHALRKGRGRLVVFDDVDIAVIVEREVGGAGDRPETLPMPYVVRKANEKGVRAIHAEIRAAQAARVDRDEVQIGSPRRALATRLFAALPRPLRHLIVWGPLTRDPFRAKRAMGTVVVTSIGNVGQGGGAAWAIPVGIHPLLVAVGGIAKRPGVVGDTVAVRECLSLTVVFDHDVTDGAPVARFLQRLTELLETGYGL